VSALLEVRDLRVEYDGVVALKGISLTVAAGEVVTLLGANGAGKTTTLRAISGLVRPLAGAILFEGEPIQGVPAERLVQRGICHVPEGRGIFAPLTVRENLALGAYARGRGDAARRNLEHVYDQFPVLRERQRQLAGSLSGGEQQMLAFGRALMADPKLLLLDEPSLGLAPRLVEEVANLIRAFAARGITMLLVEQNANVALGLAQRGYVLETGRIAVEGTAQDLRESPRIREAYLGGGLATPA
jgi:branched-chain amino acid transport system ATP-binding protein